MGTYLLGEHLALYKAFDRCADVARPRPRSRSPTPDPSRDALVASPTPAPDAVADTPYIKSKAVRATALAFSPVF